MILQTTYGECSGFQKHAWPVKWLMFVSLFCLLAISAHAQISRYVYPRQSGYPSFEELPTPNRTYLRRNLTVISQHTDISFVSSSVIISGLTEVFYENVTDTANIDYQMPYYHLFDFNMDGQKDLVYSGFGQGFDRAQTLVWLKKGNRYQFWGNLQGQIRKLRHQNQNVELLIVEGLCCGNYVNRYNLYQIPIDQKLNKRFIQSSHVVFSNITLPKNIEPANRSIFSLTSSENRLRFSPVVNNQLDRTFSSLEGMNAYGNIVAEFGEGAKGQRLGTYTDAGGRQWWLVAMYPKAIGFYNRFYNDEGAYKVGWIVAADAMLQ